MTDPTPTDVDLQPVPPARPHAVRGRFPHFPALDGLRGLAVLAAVFFDLGTKWAKGGHLGLSTLFTLTGFLAMASLLAERGDGHPIDLGRFWTRRIRHILLATLVVLGVAAAFGVAAAAAIQRHDLALDGLAALASVANWRFIATHAPFGPPTTLASPVRQFWALAVIGQVILVLSIVTIWMLERLAWSRQRLVAVLVAGVVVSTGLCLAFHHHPARVLYGTDTRAAEVLVGALLALLIYDPRITIRLAMPGPVRETINAAGVAAGLVLLVMWMTLAPTNKILLDGGLLVVAVVSATVVLAAIVPEGPVPWLLATPPLRWLGRGALALYLVHWPVFVWVDHAHTGLTGNTLILARLAAAAVGAVVIQLAYERTRAWHRAREPQASRRTELGLAGLGAVIVAAALVAVTATGPAVGSTAVQVAGSTSSSTTTVVPLPVPTVAFYGDALASTLETSAKSYAARTGKIKVVEGVASPTCGIDRDELIQDATGAAVPIPGECSNWDTQWATATTAAKPDIAIVVTGISELANHKEPTDPGFTGPGDQGYDYQLLLLMHKAVETLTAAGTKVIWLNLPNFQAGSGAPASPSNVAEFNQLLTSLGQELPGQVTVAGLGAWLAANGGPGAEPTQNGWGAANADHVVQDYLVGQIDALWRALHTPGPTTTTTAATPASAPPVSVAPAPLGVNGSGATTKTTKVKTTPTTAHKPSKTASRTTKPKAHATTTS